MNISNWTEEAKQDLLRQLISDLDLTSLQSSVPDFELIHISDSVEEAMVFLDNPDLIEGVATGYEGLDMITSGFSPEELIIISGGTGQGKTQFAQCLILNMALNNVPVLFFTLEMPPRETTIRFMRMVKSKQCDDLVPELPVYYYHGTNTSLPILDSAIQKGIDAGIKCVVIDHLHFFAKGSDNQANEIGHIVREIKLMARKYHIPIVLLCHIRKLTSPTARPRIDDLKDSSSIAQDADTVMMLWRDMDETDDMFGARVSEVHVVKNRRRGNLGVEKYKMDANGYLVEGEYRGKERA